MAKLIPIRLTLPALRTEGSSVVPRNRRGDLPAAPTGCEFGYGSKAAGCVAFETATAALADNSHLTRVVRLETLRARAETNAPT
jgi:hypothetical protein